MYNLSEEEIIGAIKEYIDNDKQGQAVLIDGEWGTGKTYFVKELLIKELERYEKSKEIDSYKAKKILYISLYGATSCEQISKDIHMNYISDNDNLNKGFNIASKVISAGLNFVNIDSGKLPKLTELISIKNTVLFFDDLERCNMDINEVLGFINSFVEHGKLKVVLVANQCEIGKLSLYNNIEQKYSIVLQNKLLFEGKSVKEDKKLEIETLKRYTKELFGENLLYEQIKEKLIGITIKYNPSIDTILSNIINKYICNDKVKDIITKNRSHILEIMKNENHNNLRTLIFALTQFEKLATIILKNEAQDDEVYDILNSILNYCIHLSIHIKSGNAPHEWKDDTETDSISLKGGIWGKSIKAYKIVDDCILHSYLNYEHIHAVVLRIIEEKRQQKEVFERNQNLASYKLSQWWELEDEEIDEYIIQIKKELEENKYRIDGYTHLINLLLSIESMELGLGKLDSIAEVMLNNIKNSQDELRIDEFSTIVNDNVRDRYYRLVAPFKEQIKKSNTEKSQILINMCFENFQNWGNDFYDFCYEHKEFFLNNKEFFFLIDLEKLVKCFENTNTKNIYRFIDGIRCVYSFENLNDFYKKDLKKILEFKQLIDKFPKNKSKTRECALNNVRSFIDKIVLLINR